VQCDRVTEAAFLLIELRYTLAQLRAQLRDLDESARAEALSDGQSIDSILEAMARFERRYQTHYAEILQLALPAGGHEDKISGYDGVERRRRKTIEMLDKVGEDWPEALLNSVKRQVADDREYATRIAEHRRGLLPDD
jgi:hypothetical protein